MHRSTDTLSPTRRRPIAVLAATMALALMAHGSAAHEPVVLPIKLGKTRILPVETREGHLAFSPSNLAFGDLLLGTSKSLQLTVTNSASVAVSATLQAPPGVLASPAALSLSPAQSIAVTVTWTPAATGPLTGTLAYAVTHAGTQSAVRETVGLSGVAGTAAALQFDCPTFGETAVDALHFGLLSLADRRGADSPSFEVEITNVGGLTARGLNVLVPSPNASYSALGVCYEGLGEAAICLAEKLGETGQGEPILGSGTQLGDLAPGASVTTVWHIVPSQVGFVDMPFDVRFGNGSDVALTVAGEVISTHLPGPSGMFFRANATGSAQEGFGLDFDPLAGNALATLRPVGFDPRTIFSLGEVDAVDLRTGSLTLMVPLGGEQPVRGPLSYELKAVFNSNIWHRTTITELERSGPGDPCDPSDPLCDDETRVIARPIMSEHPDPGFNLGSGWSLHLGRLLPPFPLDSVSVSPCPADPLAFEKHMETGPRFVYIDQDGTRHELWRELHGEEVTAADLDAIEAYESKLHLFTRDGSYLRMVRVDANTRRIEEPDGLRRTFVRRGHGQREPTLPDEWLLTSIEDPYGNRVTVEYGATTWTIRDHEGAGGTAWRTVTVHFEDWPGRTALDPMVVSQIDLPGFDGGAARQYSFDYTYETLDRPPRSLFHNALLPRCPALTPADLRVTMPRLDSVTLPDDSRWDFGYLHPTADRLRLASATLPTGATVSYQYQTAWDSPPDCENPGLNRPTFGVSRRRVIDADGTELEDRSYLRQTLRTDDVPDSICLVHQRPGNQSNPLPPPKPWSEQRVVVWTELDSDRSVASAHTFNLFPYDDDCGTEAEAECVPDGGKYRLASGRSNLTRNAQISFAEPVDSQDSSLRLSEQLYSCDFRIEQLAVPREETGTGNVPQVGDQVDALLDACTLRDTTFARYEVSKAGRCSTSTPFCLRDSRLVASRTIHHDDADAQGRTRWIKTEHSDFDGLGHYRRTVTRSNFQTAVTGSRVEQTRFQRWNPGAGTLVLDADHTVAQNITLPAHWLLGIWSYQWIDERGQQRGGEACFHPSLGHLTHERTWTKTNLTTSSNIAANRSADDLVVRHAVDGTTGELEVQRFFGADTYPGAMPTDDAWCANGSAWSSAKQDYAVDLNYQFGVLSEERVVGDSVFALRRTVDQATGWPRTETRDTGEVLTFRYDEMGRATWTEAEVSASNHVDYQQATDGRWSITATVLPAGTTAATASPAPIRIYDAAYDGLGRLRQETLPRFDDVPGGSPAQRRTVTRTIVYDRGGTVDTVTALDNVARKTRFEYDHRGRLLRATRPDGSKSGRIYVGDRKVRLVACVKTATPDSTGICSGTGLDHAETGLELDWKGRVITATTPEGFATIFTYDPLDLRTSARRSGLEGGVGVNQTRSWTYDGRGFLTAESLPERSTITFSSFTTRGLARTAIEGSRTKTRTFDRMGRLRQVAIGSRPLQRFVYCDPQSAASHSALCDTSLPTNGALIVATRNNYRTAADSGIFVAGVPRNGTWVVTSTFGYDDAGRRNSRATSIYGGVAWSADPAPATEVSTFDQSWTYDNLGNVTAIGYPTCSMASPDCGIGRSVVFTYGQGHFLTGVIEGTLGAGLTYHASGLVDEVQHQGGGGTDRYGVTLGMPRVASIDLGVGTGQRFNLGSVTYDHADNLTAIGSDVFTYDQNSRLVSATVEGTTRSYAYDNFDNHRGPGTGTIDPFTNQLAGVGVGYDTHGNLTGLAGQGVSVAYDELDKVVALTEPGGARTLGIYDHDDLRILTWGESNPAQPEATWTLRDGLAVIREYVGLGSQIKLRRDFVRAGARLVSSKTYPAGTERHYHEDQVGNARLITGHQGRRVHYAPFGDPIGGTASGERGVGFQGHENDGLTTYMRGRTYLPVLHRFLQVDPARAAGAWSLYAFSRNNPLTRIDPTGLNDRPIDESLKIPPTPNGGKRSTADQQRVEDNRKKRNMRRENQSRDEIGQNRTGEGRRNTAEANKGPSGSRGKRKQMRNRQRNVGHPNAEEHSRVAQGAGGQGARVAARANAFLLILSIALNEVERQRAEEELGREMTFGEGLQFYMTGERPLTDEEAYQQACEKGTCA